MVMPCKNGLYFRRVQVYNLNPDFDSIKASCRQYCVQKKQPVGFESGLWQLFHVERRASSLYNRPEGEKDIQTRKQFLRKIGYKL